MSVIIKFFVAPEDEAAAAVVERGPDGVFESLACGNFDIEEALIEWESIFTGRRFEVLAAADEPRVVADPDEGEGPMVLAASAPLQDALTAADQPRLAEVSQLWVRERAAEDKTLDQELATKLLENLAHLARTAGGRDARLYCWMA
ncbi:hypothetical protein [Streptomyces brasiliensis]|uniref:hypothetical protein n=1 Tax=Streptomyces brasiliensis TaxID=1954 RepID=UPI0016717E1E|nr:hypothetical protein [Streptomyces brasiliensis]